jgi:hypothetical protein
VLLGTHGVQGDNSIGDEEVSCRLYSIDFGVRDIWQEIATEWVSRVQNGMHLVLDPRAMANEPGESQRRPATNSSSRFIV